ncbi:Nucleoporin NDC1 [Rhizophlyctis rosea]|nr:Nucleoporin NDC1 [Rhizophlyctis rosea]
MDVIDNLAVELEREVSSPKAKTDNPQEKKSFHPHSTSSIRTNNILSPPKKPSPFQSAFAKVSQYVMDPSLPESSQPPHLRERTTTKQHPSSVTDRYAQMPALLRPAAPRGDEKRVEGVERRGKVVKKGEGLGERVGRGVVGQWVAEKWRRVFGGSVERRVARVFAGIQVQVWAVRALASLLVASATEDRYGSVSRDLPDVLTSMLRCLMALENYAQNVRLPSQHRRQVGSQVAVRWNLAMIDELQTAIYSVTNTFYGHLENYRFSAPYAGKLQGFVDFRE